MLILLLLLSDPMNERHTADHVGHPVEPLERRNDCSAVTASLNIMAFSVCCENALLTRFVRWRIVANVDSIGLLVRRWTQCSAGKS